MTYRHLLRSEQKWQTTSYYDLASITILLAINEESITMLQGTNIGKVSDVPKSLTIVIIRLMEVILTIFPPMGVLS